MNLPRRLKRSILQVYIVSFMVLITMNLPRRLKLLEATINCIVYSCSNNNESPSEIETLIKNLLEEVEGSNNNESPSEIETL